MRSLVKALIVLAFVLPMAAYVAGSLVASRAGDPADRGPVILRDAPRQGTPTPEPVDVRDADTDSGRNGGPDPRPRMDDNEARVVTPAPTTLDDDDDGGEEDDDDGNDDSDDGDSEDGDD